MKREEEVYLRSTIMELRRQNRDLIEQNIKYTETIASQRSEIAKLDDKCKHLEKVARYNFNKRTEEVKEVIIKVKSDVPFEVTYA